MNRNDTRRPTIGMIVTVGYLAQSFNSYLWAGAIDFAERNDVNLVMFVGMSPLSAVGYRFRQDISSKFIGPEKIDALIILTGSMNDYLNQDEIRKYCDQYRPIPMVSVAAKIKGMPSILVDNNYGIQQSVNHLVHEHHYGRIAFITGPSENYESIERLAAFRETMKMHNLKVDEKLVVSGHFSIESGKEAIRILLDKRKASFDAVIASDDDSAIGAIQELKSRGFSIPYDVAVTGFDDIEEANGITPALSTVRQPYYELSYRAAETALDLARGQEVPEVISLPTKYIVRESCGCYPRSITQIQLYTRDSLSYDNNIIELLRESRTKIIFNLNKVLANLIGKNNDLFFLSEIYDIFLDFIISEKDDNLFLNKTSNILRQLAHTSKDIGQWIEVLDIMKQEILVCISANKIHAKIEVFFQKISVLLNEILLQVKNNEKTLKERRIWVLQDISQMLITTFNIKDLMHIIETHFVRLGIKRCYIAFYKNEGGHHDYSKTSELKLAYDEDGVKDLTNITTEFPTVNLLPDEFMDEDRRHSFIFMNLFFKKEKFGYILYDIGPKDEIIYETLRGQIGSAVEGAILVEELERSNKALHHMSLNDELTGLLNRRGFFKEADDFMVQANFNNNEFLLMYIDLDGLKQINDTYGHEEGDRAIAVAADIIKDTFHPDDIIARLSGDEFVVIAIDAPDKVFPTIKQRLLSIIHRYNEKLKLSYTLSISIGRSHYTPGSEVSLKQLMSEADQDLYEDKKNKQS